ncbi:MAG TPA: cupin domain-containing protein [Firmicutes bacterium]|jgi:mannose-6-phosphate isomerase-like protein (cupin superfamily)|nr:cupin domain-containing protein [Bacillota bacterium]
MIRYGKDMVREVKERLREGKGEVEIVHAFTREELTGKARLCALIRIPPGNSIGYHPHVGEEEIYYILRGQATVNDNGNIQVVGPGDAVLTGGGASHSIENTGEETLEFFAVILLYA